MLPLCRLMTRKVPSMTLLRRSISATPTTRRLFVYPNHQLRRQAYNRCFFGASDTDRPTDDVEEIDKSQPISYIKQSSLHSDKADSNDDVVADAASTSSQSFNSLSSGENDEENTSSSDDNSDDDAFKSSDDEADSSDDEDKSSEVKDANEDDDNSVIWYGDLKIDVKNDPSWFEKISNKVLNALRTEQLQRLAENLGLSGGGKREALNKRIRKARRAELKEIDLDYRQLQDDHERTLYSYDYERVKHMCRARGLGVKGKKIKLIKALRKSKEKFTKQEEMLLDAYTLGQYRTMASTTGLKKKGKKKAKMITLIRKLDNVRILQKEIRDKINEEQGIEPESDKNKELTAKEWAEKVFEIPNPELKKLCEERGLLSRSRRLKLIKSLHAFLTGTKKKYIMWDNTRKKEIE